MFKETVIDREKEKLSTANKEQHIYAYRMWKTRRYFQRFVDREKNV